MPTPIPQTTVPTKAEMLEAVDACLYCGSSRGQIAADRVEDWFFQSVAGPFEFMRCSECGSLWLRERLRPDFLPIAYTAYYTHEQEQKSTAKPGIRSALKQAYIRQRFAGSRSLKDLTLGAAYTALGDRSATDDRYRYAPPAPSKLLDYGCGSGAYLHQMQALGHKVVGVDFDPFVVEQVRQLTMTALTPDEAAKQDWDDTFDFITLAHVIEHVPNPIELLRKLASWLRPGGRIFIDTPSADALGLQVFGRYWRGLEAPRHLSLPTRNALISALNLAGLAVHKEIVRPHIREFLWRESLTAVSGTESQRLSEVVRNPPKQTKLDAEFITIVAMRPR